MKIAFPIDKIIPNRRKISVKETFFLVTYKLNSGNFIKNELLQRILA